MTTQTRLFASEYPKRPSRHDDAVIKKTAEAMSKDVATWADDDADEDEVTQHLIKALDSNFDDNGYSLARDMERYGYSPDAELVEILDRAGHERYMAHKAVVAEWVSAHNLKLTLATGSTVALKASGKDHAGENMRADKWKLSRQMAASGIGTSEVDVTCSVSGLRGHVVGKVTRGAVSRLIR